MLQKHHISALKAYCGYSDYVKQGGLQKYFHAWLTHKPIWVAWMTGAVDTKRWWFGFGVLFVAVMHAENIHATILYNKPQHYKINLEIGETFSHIMIVVSTLPLFDHLREAELSSVTSHLCDKGIMLHSPTHTLWRFPYSIGGIAEAVKVGVLIMF